MRKNKERQNGQQKRRMHTWVVTVLSLALVSAVGFLAWLQLSNYERGVLDVYANQQDGYVQLVLDQINLNQDRSDQEIIDNILGTLDASGSRYWTFSRQDSLIFVRDVLETNRYKGFTTATYFHSESAKEFLSRLSGCTRVIHDTIRIEDVPYVASGVEFSYGGAEYKICLLTNAETVLDYNSYLNAKINLVVLAFVLLSIVVISLILLALMAERCRKKLWREVDENVRLRKSIEDLNRKIERGDLYDEDCTALKAGAVPLLLKKLAERKAWPFSVWAFRSGRPATEVLGAMRYGGDKGLLRVIYGEHEFVLFVLKESSVPEKGPFLEEEPPELLGMLEVTEKPEVSLEQTYWEFIQRIWDNGKSTIA